MHNNVSTASAADKVDTGDTDFQVGTIISKVDELYQEMQELEPGKSLDDLESKITETDVLEIENLLQSSRFSYDEKILICQETLVKLINNI